MKIFPLLFALFHYSIPLILTVYLLLRNVVLFFIAKTGTDKTFIAYWRPVTLLSAFHKIISTAVADRLKCVLETSVHSSQYGLIPNSYIGKMLECCMTFLLLLINFNYRIIVYLDLEKDCDSVDYFFIWDVL